MAYISFPSAKDPAWATGHPGKATVQIVTFASYEWFKAWEKLAWMKRGPDYSALKKKISDSLLEKLYQAQPQTRGRVVYSELSTPLSTQHFTKYSRGEIYGLAHVPDRFKLRWLRSHSPIRGLYLAGQDVITVGVGGALFSGVLAATAVLRRNVLGRILLSPHL
jgi:all-trans-retinol 13,14-reductase